MEYYRESLLEAIVYCITKGFSEEYVVSLDVDGFGYLYKYLKRIESRQRISHIGDISTAMGATKKKFREHIQHIEVWLPKQESQSTSRKSGADFQKDFKGF